MRVLIVKVSALGDVVHALPVLNYLHTVAPGIEIDWVVEEPNRAMLEGNPLIAQVHVVNTKRWRKNILSRKTREEVTLLRKTFIERQYDIVFDLQGNFKSGLIAFFSGCERRYGFDRESVREPLNLLFTTNQVPLRRQDTHVYFRALRIVSVPFGKEYSAIPLKTDIYTSPADDREAAAFLATLADGLVFLFHQGTTWETKMWHEQGWRSLIEAVVAKYPGSTILLSWGNDREKEAVDRIAGGLDGVRVLPALALKGVTALIKKVDLVVGGDTGPVHIAAAVGTPTVSFYRATDPLRNAPKGEIHRYVSTAKACRSCLEKQCPEDNVCREGISLELMVKAVESLIDSGFVAV
jgi:heptosyltransferase-1